ncbi:hypothetical protein CH337_13685 [Rhodoblastus acidophilus]|nr:hypothetical protein CKO16_01980 [Rhodoblastus acidophilus]RAI18661.1 hypothetical protein CH337_13685 [Rhodoblastus acidophilus]
MRALIALAFGCLAGAGAWAQSQAPGSEAPARDGGALSDRLDKSNGVITPERNLDPAMGRKPPPVNDPTVIPPPGAPGGDPNVRPK